MFNGSISSTAVLRKCSDVRERPGTAGETAGITNYQPVIVVTGVSEMKFQDLPSDVQAIAAQTLQTLILEERFNTEKKPATKLAEEVKSAFLGLYVEDEVILVDCKPDLTFGIGLPVGITSHLLRLKDVITYLETTPDSAEKKERFLAELKFIESELK